jgi:hypothetical protein
MARQDVVDYRPSDGAPPSMLDRVLRLVNRFPVNSTSGSHKVLDPDLDTAGALPKASRKGLPMIGIAGFHPAHAHDCSSCVVHSHHLP